MRNQTPGICKYKALCELEDAGLLISSYKAGIISDHVMSRWRIFKTFLKERPNFSSQDECVTIISDRLKVAEKTVYNAIYDLRCR